MQWNQELKEFAFYIGTRIMRMVIGPTENDSAAKGGKIYDKEVPQNEEGRHPTRSAGQNICKTILTGEGFLVGLIAGLVVLLYRVLLEYAGRAMNVILGYSRENPAAAGAWFVLLILMACIVGKLVKWEPMISGSGIPQVEGEMTGKLEQVWWRVLPAKFLGGFLSLLAGLSLGREGPSIQIGAMTGKALSKALDRWKDRRKISAHLRGQRRSGGSFPCASGRGDVFPWKRYIKIFLFPFWFR